jgi:hypothetical protein
MRCSSAHQKITSLTRCWLQVICRWEMDQELIGKTGPGVTDDCRASVTTTGCCMEHRSVTPVRCGYQGGSGTVVPPSTPLRSLPRVMRSSPQTALSFQEQRETISSSSHSRSLPASSRTRCHRAVNGDRQQAIITHFRHDTICKSRKFPCNFVQLIYP